MADSGWATSVLQNFPALRKSAERCSVPRRFSRPKGPFVEMVKRIRSDRSAPPVALLRESATEKLAVLLGRMMEFSPALRPQSAAEALAGLNEMELPEEKFF